MKDSIQKYGWIAITLVVISVLIAFAAPFANHIRDNSVGVVDGLGDKLQSGLNPGGTVAPGGDTTTGGTTEPSGKPIPDAPATGLIEDSWEEIISFVNDGTYAQRYAVGAYKSLDLGSEGVVNMQIAALDADTMTAGGTAHITWIAKELLATTHTMNDTATNANGWEASGMRTYLQNDVWALIPTNVQNAIVAVDKTYYDYTTSSTKTCSDKVWIPSLRETGFSDPKLEDSGVVYSEILVNKQAFLKKTLNGSASYWWLRTAYNGFQANFYMADGTILSSTGANGTYGIALSFCF